MLGATSSSFSQDVSGHMQAQYDAILKIQSAVIAGSLDGARQPAEWLAGSASPAGLPDGAEAQMDAMRAAAADVAKAGDLLAAADATARLGMACGNCHVANEANVEFAMPDRPDNKEKKGPHMQRHQWAADRMWEGIVAPSDYSWSRGANILFESPLRDKDLHKDEAATQMARRIHQLAANATTRSKIEDRAEIYGEFLGNCAACHQTLSVKP
jgi:cytochrome c553